MTSKEIQAIGHADQSTNAWLKVIAVQLALMNEKTEPSLTSPQPGFVKPDFPGKLQSPKARR